jgi:cytidylate kinase
MKSTITISRQMGCGGSYIGQLIATRLGLKYVDREVLKLAAQEFGCDEETVAARAERISSFWQRVFGGLAHGAPDSRYVPPPPVNFSDKELFRKQTEILKRIAAKHDCVVIGYAGVNVLPRHTGMFCIFFQAPLNFRIKRIMRIYNLPDHEKAREMIEESDQMRERYFAEMTGHDWTCAKNYHFSLDTSLFPLDDIAELLIELLKRKKIVE